MINKTRICLLLTSLFIFASVTHADTIYVVQQADNQCEQLGVQVLNKTGGECLLTSYQINHGHLLNINPNDTVLQPNFSQTFTLAQFGFGPNITLNYLCSGRKISLESSQGRCTIMAGSIYGSITETNGGVGAKYTTTPASAFWSYPGHIYWAITDQTTQAPSTT